MAGREKSNEVYWVELINALNKLENVKASMETGLVCMRKGEKWYFLNAKNATFIGFDGRIEVDYDKMRINLFDCGEICYVKYYGGLTLKKQVPACLDTISSSGIIDSITGQYVKFPPIVYVVERSGVHLNSDLKIIATGHIYEVSHINMLRHMLKFQHVYIINGFVIISYQGVTISNGAYNIGDQGGYKLFIDWINKDGFLMRGSERINLENINKYLVKPDDANSDIATFKSYIIPGYNKCDGIFEVDGVWIKQRPDSKYEPLNPIKPNSGATTKAALRPH